MRAHLGRHPSPLVATTPLHSGLRFRAGSPDGGAPCRAGRAGPNDCPEPERPFGAPMAVRGAPTANTAALGRANLVDGARFPTARAWKRRLRPLGPSSRPTAHALRPRHPPCHARPPERAFDARLCSGNFLRPASRAPARTGVEQPVRTVSGMRRTAAGAGGVRFENAKCAVGGGDP